MKLRISDYISDSIVDGPGLRLTVFTQGCPHSCVGCHNPQTHDPKGGREIDADEIIVPMAENPLLDGLTLSGGEPFLQSAACAFLAQRAHSLGLNVWTYTGYTYEELTDGGREDFLTLLRETDVLIDGRFLIAERSLEVPFRGSRNQRLIDVKRSLEAGCTIEYSL